MEDAVVRKAEGWQSPALNLTVATLANDSPVKAEAGVPIQGITLSPTLAAPGRLRKLTLLGAGVRKVRHPDGPELKVTVLGIYSDLDVVKYLSKYRGQSAEQLLTDQQFLYQFLEAPVDIVARVVFLLPMSGEEYARKAGNNTEKDLKMMNKWGGMEELALQEFRRYFKTINCFIGSSIYFTLTRTGFEISQSLDSSVPSATECAVKSAVFGQALVGTMLGINGVSPQLRASFGKKMAALLQAPAAIIQRSQQLQ
ncbi:hypothetical protein R1flu_003452 [Riccia fluitans]|uniref:Chalcone-flavonone isomerase family protein n=1 Tax=Riccia fluitans TaxID=41844 RepID=A0ABD1Y925_9MARC